MKVKNLKLLNFRGVAELYVDFTQQTTTFVGVNGVGKSTVLDALAIALSHLVWRLNGQPQKSRPISLDDIRIGADFARIEINVELRNKTIQWGIVTNRKKGTYENLIRKSDLEELNDAVENLNFEWDHIETDLQEAYDLPLAVYYDVNRAVLDIPMRVREKQKNNFLEVYHDALDHGGADFKGFFIWFRNREDFENEQFRDNPIFRDRGLAAAKLAIEEFTGFDDLRVRRNPLRMTLKKGESVLNVAQLSDGEKSMLALVGDLARRLNVLNPSLENTNHGKGVVIIDEIDLHLHPGWQREIVSKLEKTFPNCQFIISTHSAQVIGELLPESVKLLRDGKLLGNAERSIGLSSSEILEELMGTNSRNSVFHAKVTQIERAIQDEKYSDARVDLKLLRSDFGELPEVLRLEESLEWFDPTDKMDSDPIGRGDAD